MKTISVVFSLQSISLFIRIYKYNKKTVGWFMLHLLLVTSESSQNEVRKDKVKDYVKQTIFSCKTGRIVTGAVCSQNL